MVHSVRRPFRQLLSHLYNPTNSTQPFKQDYRPVYSQSILIERHQDIIDNIALVIGKEAESRKCGLSDMRTRMIESEGLKDSRHRESRNSSTVF
ncbi:MAG: hypothetical protein CAF45_007235 [Nitrospira sp. CG24E]|nr:MAG: hypothetical protein CAF45_007235 [Nitrospira sp. CG24E]